MILDMLQVTPGRTNVLEKAGGFGLLPDSGNTDFLRLLNAQQTNGNITTADNRAYEKADRRETESAQFRDEHSGRVDEADEADEDDEPKSSDASRINLQGVVELLNRAPESVAQTDGDQHKNHAAEVQQQLLSSIRDVRELRQSEESVVEDSDHAKPDADDKQLHARMPQPKLDADQDPDKKSTMDGSKGADNTAAKHGETRSQGQQGAGRRAGEHASVAAQKSESAQSSAGSAANDAAGQPNTIDVDNLERLLDDSDESSKSAVRQTGEKTQNTRRTVVQVVDLRSENQPTRVERLRADMRSGSQPNRGQQRISSEQANSNMQQNPQSGQNSGHFGGESRNNGFSTELLEQFFRGSDKTTAGGETDSSSFAQMIQRMGGNPAAMTRQFSSDAAQLLNGKFQDHLNSDIVRQAKFVLRDNEGGEIRLRLRPDSLGSVQIKLDVQDNVIAARILVENSSVRQVFEQQLASLTKAFEEAGLQLGSMEVSVGNHDTPGESSDAQEHAPLRSVRSNQQQADVLGDSVRDVAMLGTGDQLINVMA